MTETIQASHYCAAATSDDHITRWSAEISISDDGYVTEAVRCPACGSDVATYPFLGEH